MDPDAVPLEEAEEGVTAYTLPFLPLLSWVLRLSLLLPALRTANLSMREPLAHPRLT